MKHFKLNTGQQVPAIGFGTWQITPDSAAKDMVLAALEAGYRVIDTARIYGNERGVGEAIRESGIPREDLFITTKLWNDDQGYDRTIKACESSLEKLGLDYLDLYLIHWPATSKRHDSWRAFGQLLQDGHIKAAGVSNYTVEHLDDLMGRSELIPAVNQVEFHPFIYDQQKALLEYCAEHDILIEAYSPLSRLSQSGAQPAQEIAKRLDVSPQQVVLRWCVEHGTLPLPRSTNPDHIRSNFDIFDFELEAADMDALNKISDGERVTWDPAGMG
ncbi:MAG TPA: aldo/keto reductase [Candidatus Saccharimonadales bacterium]|nr:aldo/keto reductase [Candidatus Saccharimonadales bacterium]